MSEAVSADKSVFRETFKKGDFIFFEGDLESHFYIIEHGSVQIFTKKKNGTRVDICQVFEGESFGEFALLDHQPRSASAEALEDTSVIRVSEEGYKQLLEELPVWASSMLLSFSARLKNMNDLVKESPQFLQR